MRTTLKIILPLSSVLQRCRYCSQHARCGRSGAICRTTSRAAQRLLAKAFGRM